MAAIMPLRSLYCECPSIRSARSYFYA